MEALKQSQYSNKPINQMNNYEFQKLSENTPTKSLVIR